MKFFDTKLAPLKTVTVDGLSLVDGIWTPASIHAVHHQSGHETTFKYTQVAHNVDLPDGVFAAQQLTRRLPKLD